MGRDSVGGGGGYGRGVPSGTSFLGDLEKKATSLLSLLLAAAWPVIVMSVLEMLPHAWRGTSS